MSGPELLHVLLGPLAIGLVGRVVLAWLPPGAPGSHRPRGLAATWAASHLCGLVAWTALERALVASGVRDVGFGALSAPWLVLALARVVTLPAAMVPRHEPWRAAPGGFARFLGAALVATALFPAWSALAATPPEMAQATTGRGLPALDFLLRGPLAAPAAFAALLALLLFGLASAHRAPFARRLVVIALAQLPLVQTLAARPSPDVACALALGGGAAGAIGWVRRADRRGAALAVLGVGALPLLDPRAGGLALALLAGVAVATRAPSRRAWLARALPALLAGWALSALAGDDRGAPAATGALHERVLEHGAALARATGAGAWELRWIALPIALALLVLRLVRPDPAEAADARVDGTVRELAGLALATALGWLALAASWTDPWRAALPDELGTHAALLPLAALATLVCGLALCPPEPPVNVLPPPAGAPDVPGAPGAGRAAGAQRA